MIDRDEVRGLVDDEDAVVAEVLPRAEYDWLAFGLPDEGHATLVGEHATPDLPTCSLHDRLGDDRDQLETSRFGMLVVLDAKGTVLGRLDRSATGAGDREC